MHFKNDDLFMSENLKTEWESLRDGERAEIGLLQIDIEGHSKIEANARNLKKAKDIFSDEIEKIAVYHGGKLFKWEGDGGSFMFLMRDGENFNRLVNAALMMLESMPTISKRITDETDLKDPVHVRLSCDSGIAEFDKNPTRIAAEFINSFIKNERKISLADNVCITKRVYKQLDSQLRARFSFYKRSHEVSSAIYSFPRNRSLPRWKHVVLLLLLGMILGLLCAAILAYFNRVFSFHAEPQHNQAPLGTSYPPGVKRASPVRMVGSGTVLDYLTELKVIDSLGKDGKDVSIIDCPTETGGQLFAGTSEPGKYLVMASEKLSPDNLRQGVNQWEPIYEVYLGADPLQVLFAFGGKRLRQPSDSDKFFYKERQLTKEKLVELWGNKYDVYVGVPTSGTRKSWEDYLFGIKHKLNPWSFSIKPWTQHNDLMIEWKPDDLPRLYLGSEVLNKTGDAKMKEQNVEHNLLTMVDSSGKPQRRPLYLYGWINTREDEYKENGETKGYYLPRPVVEILRYVFDSLEGSESLLDKRCLEEQREYFHIKRQKGEPEGWVKKYKPNDFYQSGTCKEP